jgi:ribulose-5-phosphate 4-epimerase/fuculose-1-phosphate aldolase
MGYLACQPHSRALSRLLSFGLGDGNGGRHQHQGWVSFLLLLLYPRKIVIASPYKRDKVYIAPSGVQKERILPSHIFVLPFPSPGGDRVFLRRPSLNLKESACTPLFWNAFDLRGAGSCIHTHSQNAVIITLLTEGNMFRISHQVGVIYNIHT